MQRATVAISCVAHVAAARATSATATATQLLSRPRANFVLQLERGADVVGPPDARPDATDRLRCEKRRKVFLRKVLTVGPNRVLKGAGVLTFHTNLYKVKMAPPSYTFQ